MQKLRLLFIASFIICGTAVAQETPFRIDPSTDFSKFKTYRWDESKNTERVTNQVDAQVTDALESELARKDLKKADSDAANLLTCYHSNFGTKEIKRYTMYQGESTYAWKIKTGEVAIDMFDASTKKLVWHNSGHQPQSQTAGHCKGRDQAPKGLSPQKIVNQYIKAVNVQPENNLP